LSGTTFASFSYSRDNAGQVTSETDTGTPGAGTATSTYNSMNDLTANNGNSYSYSSAQNLTTSPSGESEQYNAGDGVCWQGTGSGACSSPPSGATTYSYSNEKNRTSTLPSSGTSDAYTYNPANELTGVVPSSGSFSSYVDDGNALLQGETTGSTTTNYTWSVQPSLPLLLSDGTNYYIYGAGNNPIEQIAVSGGATSYLLADELGSIRAITNSSGTTTGTFTYDAWGNETGSTGSATTPFGFAGEYLDSASGLYYMRARWYDPMTGQFTSLDPDAETTEQPFSYAKNSPMNQTDSTGQYVCGPGGCTGTSSAVCSSAPGAGNAATQWNPVVDCVLSMLGQSTAYAGDVDLMIANESSGNPSAYVAVAGGQSSYGLIQVTLAVFAYFRSPYLQNDIDDPAQNLYVGLSCGIYQYKSIGNINGVLLVNQARAAGKPGAGDLFSNPYYRGYSCYVP